MESGRIQFNLRDGLLLMAATAVWTVFLTRQSGWQGQGLVMLTGIAVLAGMVGHLVYRFVLAWRITVAITALLLYSIPALLILAGSGSMDPLESIWILFEILISPARDLIVPDHSQGRFSPWAGLLAALMLAPAHSISPRMPWAIVTALGVAAWYATGLEICIARYFGS